MISKSLIRFSVNGQGCVPTLLFDLRPNYDGGNEDNVYLLQKVPCRHCCSSAPNPAGGHHRPRPLPETLDTHGQVWVGLLWGHCSFLLSPGVHKVLFVPSKSLFPQSCVSLVALWWVNDNLLQKSFYHTQVCCTQSPCPCRSPLLTSSGDTQTLFCLSLWGVSGSWCAQGLLEPSERLWRVWGLILNPILPLPPSFWGLFLCPWTWDGHNKGQKWYGPNRIREY